ncbi:Abi family protein [Acinetobacter baumannii]|jgi:abortive infection bacteriophage resistance protein|uniref:Abi family protein n=1 Tax=Acinetobacter baumannii TaxID=470 RepID=UPI00034AFE52|nr:Abi family protein [Acinetobacter baumannii]EXA92672.1 abi-like family protein [Acinetobacter baumannii 1267820]MCT9356873.1 Abi family protein [Acinetobacter baumannii]MCT9487995.1 Abi family protein [Acinetobacter baumannii]RCU27284.1 Abi family protein [Acinetobacter baumannii]
MSLKPYIKPFRNQEYMYRKLVNEGLVVDDKRALIDSITIFSYYRFKAYFIPFRLPKLNFIYSTNFQFIEKKIVPYHIPKSVFRKNVHSSHLIQLYKFDEALREMLFGLIQKIEILLRSTFDRHLNKHTSNNFWYLDNKLFKENKKIHGTVNTVRTYFIESQEEFATFFRKNYFNPYCPFYRDLPPGWVAIELMTFGNIKSFMEGISEETRQEYKLDRYANKTLHVANYQTLENWVSLILDVRNCCCHHSRVFNRNFRAPTNIARKVTIPFVKYTNEHGVQIDQHNRIYSTIIIMNELLKNTSYGNIVPTKLKQLFVEHPIGLEFLPAMGIPDKWFDDPMFS